MITMSNKFCHCLCNHWQNWQFLTTTKLPNLDSEHTCNCFISLSLLPPPSPLPPFSLLLFLHPPFSLLLLLHPPSLFPPLPSSLPPFLPLPLPSPLLLSPTFGAIFALEVRLSFSCPSGIMFRSTVDNTCFPDHSC